MPKYIVPVTNVTEYSQTVEYEVEADSPEAAEESALNQFFAGGDERWDTAERQYLDGSFWTGEVREVGDA